ncbi:MAG: NACHT domain-containing protein, partial [Ruminiclostridium sp.]
VLDFSTYLEKWIDNYEKNDLKKIVKYLPLSANNEDKKPIGQLDKYLSNWINDSGTHITLLGNYGTGKSTTLRRLMWLKSKDYLSNPDNKRIPIFIELKGFKNAPKTRQLITDMLVNEYDLKINFVKFQELNNQGKFLIILDGFDEMVDKVIDGNIQEHFNELSTLACENSKVILSCRTHYFKDHNEVLEIHNENVEENSEFQILFLNNFTEKDIDEYLKAFFKESWEFYKKTIMDTYDLYSLAEIPILLNMIVETLPEIKKEGKPINRPSIYETFTNRWLKRDLWRKALHTGERIFFCEQLALHFYTSQVYSVHWKDLPMHIKNYFGELIKTSTVLDIFDNDVRTSNFLKRKEDSGEYSFVHKSFMEYFVARLFYKNIKEKLVNGLDLLKDYTKSRVIYEFLLEMVTSNDINILKDNISRNKIKNRVYTSPYSLGNCAFFLLINKYDMRNAYLDTAIFKGFKIENISFEHGDLGSTVFEDCKIKDVSFKEAILGYSTFEDAELTNVDFSGCTLNKVNFKNTKMDNKTLETIAKSKNWGTAILDVRTREKIDKFYKSSGEVKVYQEL